MICSLSIRVCRDLLAHPQIQKLGFASQIAAPYPFSASGPNDLQNFLVMLFGACIRQMPLRLQQERTNAVGNQLPCPERIRLANDRRIRICADRFDQRNLGRVFPDARKHCALLRADRRTLTCRHLKIEIIKNRQSGRIHFHQERRGHNGRASRLSKVAAIAAASVGNRLERIEKRLWHIPERARSSIPIRNIVFASEHKKPREASILQGASGERLPKTDPVRSPHAHRHRAG